LFYHFSINPKRKKYNIKVKYFYLDSNSWEWWYTLAIPVLRRQKQEDHKLKVNLGYIVRWS
jgi:hypothetical protein